MLIARVAWSQHRAVWAPAIALNHGCPPERKTEGLKSETSPDQASQGPNQVSESDLYH